MNEKKTFAVITLGCKLNYAESATIARDLMQQGYEKISSSKKADVYLINTCSVTEHADKKSRQAIRKVLRINPSAYVVVTGCSAQLRPGSLGAIKGISSLFGTGFRDRIIRAVGDLEAGKVYIRPSETEDGFFRAYSAGENNRDRTRSFLKVQDGCDYHCTYCTVPLARGRSRNIPIADVVSQAREIAAKGVKEIVLTGVNTGDFGKTTGESFSDLLDALATVSGIERYRISSIEPNLLTDGIIEKIAAGKPFLPHFHIPLQSGSDPVLKRMGRRYRVDLFAQKMQKIHSLMPHAFTGIDVITGFPGESEEDFINTYNLLKDLKPSYLHVFPFSVRPGTRAASFPVSERVRDGIITRRAHELGELSDMLHRDFILANKGRQEEVLFEGKTRDRKMHGYTRNYIRVERPYQRALINRVVEVILD
ncbi:MAG TPA: tRNA (N(6)-L-threonylcarbamoyladenosine(37)-C(2))-methylthiotransferase MtaB [Bacteroidales bacterium]|nr:tRNA (N(6)-L-threonylcarbamoyladenosine(37)-C(2))-methylthiotransferase MtaB [Bacteroidales bacterium]HRW94343.1 tRNA (N(6)-L-threonylcarbamoyladenosine(37)-C(2))-methylthiotransferase MtaB [Bacteroidales bacterium]